MKSVTITPKKLNGSVEIPPSKSISHRAIICAALAGGVSEINNIGFSNDIEATIDAMSAFGANITTDGDRLIIDGGSTFKNTEPFSAYCNESGSTLRFLVPLAMHCTVPVTFTGSGRLPERPLNSYYDIFDSKSIKYINNKCNLPLTVTPGDISGTLYLEGNISSQFVSGLLLTLPLFPYDSEIIIKSPLESRAYVDMTIDIMSKFGVTVMNNKYKTFRVHGGQKYKPAKYTIEGDFSQAAFYLAAGAIGSFIVCKGLNTNSKQGDMEFLNIIEKMGGKIIVEGNDIAAIPSHLKGCTINVAQTPDLVPAIAVMAAMAKGETKIINAGRLRIKESDRLTSVTQQLNLLGATILEKNDGLIIVGTESLNGGTTNSVNDHRIAMALAIASTCCNEEVVIEDSTCVNKSYPNFWLDYKLLGGVIDEWNMGE